MFVVEEERLGEVVVVELKPGGKDIPVTEENKQAYVDAVVAYQAGRVQAQFDALRQGLLEFVPLDLLEMFDEKELETLFVETWRDGDSESYVPVPYLASFVVLITPQRGRDRRDTCFAKLASRKQDQGNCRMVVQSSSLAAEANQGSDAPC